MSCSVEFNISDNFDQHRPTWLNVDSGRRWFLSMLPPTRVRLDAHPPKEDEEAILSGAVLLKPGASIFESTIPMYTPGKTCLESRPDGLDIGEVLAAALSKQNLPELERIRARTTRSPPPITSNMEAGGCATNRPCLFGWPAVSGTQQTTQTRHNESDAKTCPIPGQGLSCWTES